MICVEEFVCAGVCAYCLVNFSEVLNHDVCVGVCVHNV